jgi:hypothetical protein
MKSINPRPAQQQPEIIETKLKPPANKAMFSTAEPSMVDAELLI